MRRLHWSLPIVLALVGVAGAAASDSKKSANEPFYRKYLVPGAPLDDKIVEQEKRIEAHPDDANLHNDLGNLLAERRFPNEAAEQYEIALKLDKKNFVSAYNLGLVRETQGKAPDAISAYQRSIKRKPGFPQSRFRLGRLYEHTNQPESAVREYAAAFWIDPGLKDPRRNPLVVDCELVYLASLANYRQDVAVAAMTDSNVYFDAERFRKLPTNRAIGAKEVAGEAPSETVGPRDVGGAPATPGSAGASEPARRAAPRTVPAAGAPGAPPPGMLGVPAERPTPVPRRPQPPARSQAAPNAAPASPSPAPPESVEPTPVPEVPPEGESAPEAEPS